MAFQHQARCNQLRAIVPDSFEVRLSQPYMQQLGRDCSRGNNDQHSLVHWQFYGVMSYVNKVMTEAVLYETLRERDNLQDLQLTHAHLAQLMSALPRSVVTYSSKLGVDCPVVTKMQSWQSEMEQTYERLREARDYERTER